MNIQDALAIFLIIFLVITTFCIVLLTFFLVQALKAITQLSDNIEDAANNLKSKFQLKAFATIPALLVSLASKVIRKRR